MELFGRFIDFNYSKIHPVSNVWMDSHDSSQTVSCKSLSFWNYFLDALLGSETKRIDHLGLHVEWRMGTFALKSCALSRRVTSHWPFNTGPSLWTHESCWFSPSGETQDISPFLVHGRGIAEPHFYFWRTWIYSCPTAQRPAPSVCAHVFK